LRLSPEKLIVLPKPDFAEIVKNEIK